MRTSLYQRYYSPCPSHDMAPNGELAIRAADYWIKLPECGACQSRTRATIIEAHKHVIGRNDMTPARLCQRFKWRYQSMLGDTPTAWAHRLEAWRAAAADWRHAASCDCLQCVTDRITADKRQEVA